MDQTRPLFPFPDELMDTTTASEDFKSNILEKKKYVDKTQILIPILRRRHETTLFLHPRRFGKTLTLSMLHYYLEDTRNEALNAENRRLFEGMPPSLPGSGSGKHRSNGERQLKSGMITGDKATDITSGRE